MASLTPEQRRLFQDKNFVAVATVGKDGGPRNAIVWVDIEGDTLIINGARSRAWLKNLKRNPGVAVAVFDPTNPYRRVTVIGTAVAITEEGGEAHIDKLSMKYNNQPYPLHEAHNPRTIVRIRPDRVSTMGF